MPPSGTLEQEKLASLAEFAAAAGHEINNPLAVICGRAELLLQHEQHPERRRDLTTIYSQAMRIHDLIEDLMLFARPPAPRKQLIDVSELIAVLCGELQGEFESRQVALCRQHISPGLVVHADRTQLLVVLRELCENALRELEPGGRVVVSARSVRDDAGHERSGFAATAVEVKSPGLRLIKPKDSTAPSTGNTHPLSDAAVQIRIQDSGPGIADEVRRHLFDPFYSGRSAGRGLGMGLAKCWRIVTNHGGQIEVESQPGHGATFIITLPCDSAPE
jgi:signal transduction histidine kinase